ncbi:hypothetical protein ACLOJK_004670 [Asimina triloba]
MLEMAEEQPITPEDLNTIREGYNIPISIVLSAPAPALHETSQDYHPGHLCLNEHMLRAGVRVPFEFERDIWGVPEQWEEPLPHSIPQSYVRLSAFQRWTLMYFRGTSLHWFPSREEFFHWCKSVHFIMLEKGKKRAPKRARPLEEGSILVDFDSSIEVASKLSPIRGSSTAVNRVDRRRASLPQESFAQSGSEGIILSLGVAQLREELEASHVEVVRLQSLLRGDGV